MRREKSSAGLRKGSWCAIVDVVEEASSQARQKRANRTNPQPWIVRKLMVFVTLGIIAYSAYVYIGRLCVKMILERRGAGGSRAAGVSLLVVFCILLLWMLWAYAKVVLTPPGFARDHVHQSHRPSFLDLGRPGSFRSEDLDLEMNSTNRNNHRPQPSTSTTLTHNVPKPDSIAGPSYESIAMRDDQQRTPNAKQTDTSVRPSPATTGNESEKPSKLTETWKKNLDERPLRVWRRPPTTPVLHPGHRFCAIDEIVKPYRTHHCRTCGTCILKYDHHCPWIGQCVGARNQKFFLNFNQAAFAYTSYILSTLLAYTIRKAGDANGDVDAQEIVIIALAGLFTIFTGGLLATHVLLITKGQTTVENMQIKRMKERESQALNRTLGFCSFLEKRRTKKRWNEEWGRIDKEGNIWWLESANKEWTEVMGRNPFGWFLPIGRSLNNGLTYPVNPRFSRYGRWRRREEWPPELR